MFNPADARDSLLCGGKRVKKHDITNTSKMGNWGLYYRTILDYQGIIHGDCQFGLCALDLLVAVRMLLARREPLCDQQQHTFWETWTLLRQCHSKPAVRKTLPTANRSISPSRAEYVSQLPTDTFLGLRCVLCWCRHLADHRPTAVAGFGLPIRAASRRHHDVMASCQHLGSGQLIPSGLAANRQGPKATHKQASQSRGPVRGHHLRPAASRRQAPAPLPAPSGSGCRLGSGPRLFPAGEWWHVALGSHSLAATSLGRRSNGG